MGKLEKFPNELHKIRQFVTGEISARGAYRVPLRQGTGAAPPRYQAPARFDGVLRTITRPCEEQGGGCLAKQGPRCRGRGEAAGDYVFTAEPCRTAAVDRTVARPLPHRLNSIYCRRWGLRPRPGSSGKTEQGNEEKMEGFFTWKGPSTDCRSGSPEELL